MRRCCCRKPRVCVFFRDDFTRANSSDLGPKWTVVSGDWSISGNKLVVDSAGGLIRGNTRHPSRDESMCVGVTVEPLAGACRLIVNYLDANNYLFGRFDFQNLTISIGRRVGGGETIIRQVSTPQLADDETVTLTLTFSKAQLNASASSSLEGAFDCAEAISGGYYYGFQSEGGAALTADDYSARHHDRTWHKYEPSETCCESVCQCIAGLDAKGFEEWRCIPRNLTATFVATDDLEPTLDGATIDLVNDSDIEGQANQIWEGQETICQEDWCFKLLCGGNDLSYWALCHCGLDNLCVEGASGWDNPNALCSGITGLGVGAHPTSVSCDPLILEFGPFAVTNDTGGMPGDICRCMPDPGYGTYKLVITESAP